MEIYQRGHFDKNLINEIYKQASVKPDERPRSTDGLELPWVPTFEELLKIASVQNWNEFLLNARGALWKNEEQFAGFLENDDHNQFVPDQNILISYLKFQKNYFGRPEFYSNFSIVDELKRKTAIFASLPLHCFIYGEEGTRKENFVRLLIEIIESANSFENISVIPCAKIEDLDDLRFKYGIRDKILSYFVILASSFKRKMLKIVLVNHFENIPMDIKSLILDLINSSALYKVDLNHIMAKRTIFFLQILLDSGAIKNSLDPLLRPDLGCSALKGTFLLPSLRHSRCDIPLIIQLRSQIQKAKLHFNHDIYLPHPLLQYWLGVEMWPQNYCQLEKEVNEYSARFIELYKSGLPRSITVPGRRKRIEVNDDTDSDESKKTGSLDEQKKKVFMALLGLSSNPGFKDYISHCSLEPYDLISIDVMVLKPYLYYAMRSYNKEQRAWKINLDSVRKHISEFSELKDRSDRFKLESEQKKSDTSKDERKAPIEPRSARAEVPQGAFDSIIPIDATRIRRIVAEVPDDESCWPKIKLFLDGEKNSHELTFDESQRVQLALLVFLVYERSNRDEKGSPRIPDWGLDWLTKAGSENFPPYEQTCKWCGYDILGPTEELPGWWNPDNLKSSISKLRGTLSNKNKIQGETIITCPRRIRSAFYRLRDDLKAEIINIKKI
jgi:hypothetical protein